MYSLLVVCALSIAFLLRFLLALARERRDTGTSGRATRFETREKKNFFL